MQAPKTYENTSISVVELHQKKPSLLSLTEVTSGTCPLAPVTDARLAFLIATYSIDWIDKEKLYTGVLHTTPHHIVTQK